MTANDYSPIGYQLGGTYLTKEELEKVRKIDTESCIRTAKADCIYCAHSCGTNGGRGISNITCNYIIDTGHIRPCFPGECRQKGVFEKSTRAFTAAGKRNAHQHPELEEDISEFAT